MSDPQPTTHDDLLPLIEALVNGTIDDARFARLDQVLCDDPGARRFYRRYMNLHAALPGLVGSPPRMTLRLSDAAADEIELDPADSAVVEALAELARRHEESLRGPISLTDYRKPTRREPVTPVHRAVRVKARLVLAGALAAAVALAVGLVLVVNLLAPANQPTAQQTPEQDPVRPVASLTDARDAAWTDEQDNPIDLRVGDQFSPGARLILSDGLAELTTARGAVVTLEAPCEIELIDHDNALRLHAGRLVGLVETDRASGLLVRTPHMDVTDLGTRFGVDASQPDATEVHVFEGVISVARPDADRTDQTQKKMLAGTSLRAQAGRDGMQSIEIDSRRFAGIDLNKNEPSPARLAEAGIDALSGQVQWSANRYKAKRPADWPASDQAAVFEELRGHTLGTDIPIMVDQPGTYGQFMGGSATGRIAQGTTIRSYILVYKPKQRDGESRVQGRLSFGGQILGVIANEQDWRAFAQAIPEQTFYPSLVQYSLINGTGDRDQLVLSPDRRTLSFRFTVTSGPADVARIIVREPTAPTN